jgi:hypothetical protein
MKEIFLNLFEKYFAQMLDLNEVVNPDFFTVETLY